MEHSIHSSLSLGLYDNARFLAERLVAAAPTEVRGKDMYDRTTPGRLKETHLIVVVAPLSAATQVPASHLLPALQPGIQGDTPAQRCVLRGREGASSNQFSIWCRCYCATCPSAFVVAVIINAGSTSESSRYLAALCCLDLRQYTEAESLLIGHGEALVSTLS